MTFWNSMFSKSQAVLSAIRKVPTMSIFKKNILSCKKLESNLRIVKDNYFIPYGNMPGKMKGMTTKKELINFMNNCTLADILKVKGITGDAIENRGPGVDNKSRTERHGYYRCNMGVEIGATTSLFPCNRLMVVYLKANSCGFISEEATKYSKSLWTPDKGRFTVLYSFFGNITTFQIKYLFKVASQYFSSAVGTTETKPAVADTNESIIVAGFPKPNGLPQLNPFNGPERDLVNFPRMVRLEDPPKTRYLFVPEKWFEVFYEKTGVTGPYVLAAGITTFVLSKEIWVVDHEFPYVLATIGLFYVGWKKIASSLANFLDKEIHEYEASCNGSRKGEIDSLKKLINDQKIELDRTEAEKHVIQAKRENIAIQLEAVQRERAIQAYNQVKRRLDYQVDLAKLTRKVQHRFIVNWIVDNVKSTINEKDNFKKCMEDLQTLAAKQK